MNAWESIRNTIDWIEEHLAEPMALDELAAEANLSPFYYQRLFRRTVKKPLREYIMLRRLARAADTLAAQHHRIVDVAFEVGFENHETFTRAFKRTYGLTPEQYRTAPVLLSHFRKPDLSMQYRLVDIAVPLVADGVVLEMRDEGLSSPRYFAGVTRAVPVDFSPGVDNLVALWNQFHRIKAAETRFLPGGPELGVSYPGPDDGTFTYFAGAEVKAPLDGAGDFETWTLPPGSYTVCEVEAESFQLLVTEALEKARDYLFGVWLPERRRCAQPFLAELYGAELNKEEPEPGYDPSRIEGDDAVSVMELWVKTDDVP